MRRVSDNNCESLILVATVPTTQNRQLDIVDQLKSHQNSTIFTVSLLD